MSRAVREGSVGLMLLAGVGIFIAATLWLRGFTPGSQKYNIMAKFSEAAGIQQGGAVRFRGIRVGKIADIKPNANGVDVLLEISDPTLKIPRNSVAEVSQTGLIGEPVIEIVPQGVVANLSPDLAKAVDTNCDGNQIVCNNAEMSGRAGASFNELLRRATALVNRYESPELYNSLKKTLDNASQAAADISTLSRKFGDLPESLKKELASLSASANGLTQSLDVTIRNANGVLAKVGTATDKISATTDKFGVTADRIGRTADAATLTAASFGSTAADVSRLSKSVEALVTENRQTFNTTLTNFSALSVDLRKTINSLDPTIAKLNTTVAKVNSEGLVSNLEGVLANANKTAANLRDITGSFNNLQTLSSLKETLDSARVTFQNVQKITADLDDITGDPTIRNNIKKLINGLGQLVSTGETLEQQIRLANELEPVQRNLAQSTAELGRTGALDTIDPSLSLPYPTASPASSLPPTVQPAGKSK
jgi:phospholipid/cholesterol/gamma-HCH transport system substrate-binding protein